MKHLSLLILLFALFCASSASASRAKTYWTELRLSDGTTAKAQLVGDEWSHHWRTADGSLWAFDGQKQALIPLAKVSPNKVSPAGMHHLSAPNTSWDAQKVYKSLVVLVEFADKEFTIDNPAEYYQRLFNEQGYNEGGGPGCVADYYRDQSAGLFNTQFTVVGPVKVDENAKSESGSNHGKSAFRAALQQVAAQFDRNFSFADFDWNGDGRVEQVVFVYAGYGGNESSSACTGLIWPNTSSFSSSVTADGVTMSTYTASPELFYHKTDVVHAGVGTICHEFSHCLGLPDLYPTGSSSEYSVVDEWDLMDGGNFTNDGWCPPSLSAHERMQLGWLSPEELTEAATIEAMPAYANSGKAYQVISDVNPNEFYILENRQFTGWDAFLPGHGLAIWHIYYVGNSWLSNAVNNDETRHLCDLFHADNMSYTDWQGVIKKKSEVYVDGHSRFLSGTAYPSLNADSALVDALTDSSVPAATLYMGGTKLMSKPIEGITESENGLISFRFCGGTDTGLRPAEPTEAAPALYNLAGRRIQVPQKGQIYVARYADGRAEKRVR